MEWRDARQKEQCVQSDNSDRRDWADNREAGRAIAVALDDPEATTSENQDVAQLDESGKRNRPEHLWLDWVGCQQFAEQYELQ